jgi:hypothetical protein
MSTLPKDILDIITLYSTDENVAKELKDHLSKDVYDALTQKNVLINGSIQSGKTKEIIKILKDPLYQYSNRVIVIQNSILMLKQYMERLKKAGIGVQVIHKRTKRIKEKTLILLNNKKRYRHFFRCYPEEEKYILLLDEADQTITKCPLQGYKTFYVTATPYKFPASLKFNKIIKVQHQTGYMGLEDIHVEELQHRNDTRLLEDFISNTDSGMFLVSCYYYFAEMYDAAERYSNNFRNTPVVLLSTNKYIFFNGRREALKNVSVSYIIDKLSKYDHIIFIAGRLAGRGLSYTSSDYKRHLTHQLAHVQSNVTSFIQKMRLLGVYKDDQKLTLYINNREAYDKHINYMQNYDLSKWMVSENV